MLEVLSFINKLYRHKQPHAHIHIIKTTILAEVKGLSLFAAIGYMVREVFVFVSYVKNNAFPQPLSSDDERKYLELMEQGDAQARNLLIEHNLRLVAHIVKRLCTQNGVMGKGI